MLLTKTQSAALLQPLAQSYAADDAEAQLRGLFMSLFEAKLRAQERRINALGMPHNGDFALIERAIKADGLAMFRGSDEGAMRYLHKAWRARNPRRGLAFMAAYLRALFPGQFNIVQQWQDKAQPYPTALSDEDGGNHFLTSRVVIRIGGNQASQVIVVASALRSAAPARLLIFLEVIADDIFDNQPAIANGIAGLLIGQFEGSVI